MSGGVDSSVAAALLKKQGFQVTGVFMKLNSRSSDSEFRARKVAEVLEIPFKAVDFRKEFRKKVIGAFLKEYHLGFTPNPCVVCNKEIKFGLLLKKALAFNADYVASGHYVQKKGVKLTQGKDHLKDQSYFLWKLDQKQIKRILFPVGSYTKSQVRAMAKKFGLPVWQAPESQEICFVDSEINNFLRKHLKSEKGEIIDTCGKVLGKHQGLIFYTIGQRKGIGLPQGPYWVKDRDFKKNVLVVTKNENDLLKKELVFRDANWLSGKPLKFPFKATAKIRYRSKLASVNVFYGNRVVFSQPQRAITPGQSVVFYKNQELLGGGIIS